MLVLPAHYVPALRFHWLTRFYGFGHDEIVTGSDGLLSLDVDPKLAWALAHRERFPVDLNRAPRELLLRVPGLGVKSVDKLIMSRRWRRLRHADLARMRLPLTKLLPFIELADHNPGPRLDSSALPQALVPRPRAPRPGMPLGLPVQASLFDAA